MEHHSVQSFGNKSKKQQQNMDGHLNWQAMSNSVKLNWVHLYIAKWTTVQGILLKYDQNKGTCSVLVGEMACGEPIVLRLAHFPNTKEKEKS